MVIFKNTDQVTIFLSNLRKQNLSLGFVPTMGALHKGHISLIQACKKQNNVAVCSIFINPAQFNNKEDFDRYPVTTEKDIELLIQSECDILFLPSVDEIYPPGYENTFFKLGRIETVLEGKYRPGHFQGVCRVVKRLLEIVQPQNLYLGQKDYQQCMVIRKLIEITGNNDKYNLIIEPTVREADGLAMSSRNLRLTKEDRLKAPALAKALVYIRESIENLPLELLKKNSREMVEREGFVVDYVEIVDADTLEVINDHSKKLIALIAATINNIRLIDNLILN